MSWADQAMYMLIALAIVAAVIGIPYLHYSSKQIDKMLAKQNKGK